MTQKRVRVAVTGAAGQIGYALLFRIASGAMFGPNYQVDLNLLELPQALSALEGVKMELEDCAFPLLNSITCTDDMNIAFKEADWVLLVGSVPRKQGMERKDLLNINGKIFIGQGKAIAENANKDCKVLVVGNPCNTNAYIAKAFRGDIPEKNFFAMTMLDQHRAYSQLAMKAGVHTNDINGLVIWGNHSSTQYPNFKLATIEGKKAEDVITDSKWFEDDFIPTVQQRGAAIIKARGASSAASAANAVVDTVRNLMEVSDEDEVFSVAVSSDGSYGIAEGIMFSFPMRSKGNGEWEIVQGLEIDAYSQEKLKLTEKELLEEKATVDALI